MSYRTDCPKCGRTLAPTALGPDTAPWLCNDCHRGFWAAELTVQARSLYRQRFHDFGLGRPGLAVRAAVVAEHGGAMDRGTSLRPDQLPLAHKDHLSGLRDVSEDFAAAVAVELARRG